MELRLVNPTFTGNARLGNGVILVGSGLQFAMGRLHQNTEMPMPGTLVSNTEEKPLLV
ncbi:hypothetical protein D3C81_1908970 [compost metagenome]